MEKRRSLASVLLLSALFVAASWSNGAEADLIPGTAKTNAVTTLQVLAGLPVTPLAGLGAVAGHTDLALEDAIYLLSKNEHTYEQGWQEVTNGIPRGWDAIQFFTWQDVTYALVKKHKDYHKNELNGLYRLDLENLSWHQVHSIALAKLDQVLVSESHAVILGEKTAISLLADGSLGDSITIPWGPSYNGYQSTAIRGANLYIWDTDANQMVRFDLDSGTSEILPQPPLGQPYKVAAHVSGELFITTRFGASDWWNENGYSAKVKVDGGNWDPVTNRWIYKRAVYRLHNGQWIDTTANMQCGNLTNAISPGPVKQIFSDVDGEPLIVVSEQGSWKWRPETADWERVYHKWYGGADSVDYNRLITHSYKPETTYALWSENQIDSMVFAPPENVGLSPKPFLLPDGAILAGFDPRDGSTETLGPHIYNFGPNPSTTSYNLEVDFASILGESVGNTIVAAEVVADNLVAVIGTFAGQHEVRYYNGSGEMLGRPLVLPAEPTDADVDASRLAVATVEGPVVIGADRVGMTTLAVPITVENDADNRCRVDFDGDRIAWLGDKTVRLYTADLQLLLEQRFTHSYVTDVAVDSARQQLGIVGFDNKENNNPVQLPVARAFSYAGGMLAEQWHLWKFQAGMLNEDMADSRLYHVLYAGNGDMYVAGETAGGNTVFRWNGVDLTTPVLVSVGAYSDPWQTRSEHKLYYGRIDPDAGVLRYGQMCFPRKSNFEGNTFNAKSGDLEVTADGTLYFTGSAGAYIEGRDLNRINMQRVGTYDGGDITLLMVDPDFKHWPRWTVFNAEHSSGGGKALAIADGYAVLAGNINKGSMIVTDGSTPFSPDEDGITDAYMVVWNPAQDQ